MSKKKIAHYHLPGLFEFYELYKVFLPLYREHRDYFYDWCDIGSIYGAPGDCLWGGGRVGFGDANPGDVLELMKEYHISARLTYSNLLLTESHLQDSRCNRLCELFEEIRSDKDVANGIIISSDILRQYIEEHYPGFYFVSSTTKVITNKDELYAELSLPAYRYVVPDFRFNMDREFWQNLPDDLRDKVEFLCNECCYVGCTDRRACYENVSMKALSGEAPEHICRSPHASEGYVFSRAMESPAFIGIDDIRNVYLPMGYSNFKIEGRSLGSALILEFLLYYMTKPECQLKVREAIYLDHSLDLF